MDTRYKGFQYITVTHDKHHVDFVNVPWGTTDYQATCDYAFDLHTAGALAPKTARDASTVSSTLVLRARDMWVRCHEAKAVSVLHCCRCQGRAAERCVWGRWLSLRRACGQA